MLESDEEKSDSTDSDEDDETSGSTDSDDDDDEVTRRAWPLWADAAPENFCDMRLFSRMTTTTMKMMTTKTRAPLKIPATRTQTSPARQPHWRG